MLDNSATISIYGSWEIRSVEDGYEVFKGDEVHKTMTYKGAHFLKNLFNDQDKWFNWDRHGIYNTITLSSTDGLMVGTQFHNPPQANVKLFFGDAEQDYSTYFQFYLKKPPNSIQRWFLAKTFGLKMVLLK